MRAMALAVCLVAGEAAALDVLTNDYARIFADHDGEVMRITGTDGHHIEVIDLPGGIEVSRRIDARGTRYAARDLSDQGAVGCVLNVAVELARLATHCGPAYPQELSDIGAALDRLAGFVADNRVPAVAHRHVRAAISAEIARVGDVCTAPRDPKLPRTRAEGFARTLRAELDTILAVPRLPVDKPCF